MGLTALHIILWLLTAVTLTTQELARLNVSAKITAECGKQVTLNCNELSSQNQKLSVKNMSWGRNTTTLCYVDSTGKVTHHNVSGTDFHCEYKPGKLSLIFQNMHPQISGESNPYRCKLRSDQGYEHGSTEVELQECSGTVESHLIHHNHTCTFKRVYPDGDVHWFHGSHNLSDTQHKTYKNVDKDGWLTIRSVLERKSSHIPYNCSLMSTKSGRHIASALVKNPNFQNRDTTKCGGSTPLVRSGAGSQGPMKTFLCISILIVVTLT